MCSLARGASTRFSRRPCSSLFHSVLAPTARPLLTHATQQVVSKPVYWEVANQKDAHVSAILAMEQNLEELERLGFTVVQDVFSEAEIRKMQADYVDIERSAREMISNTAAQPRVWFENGVETRSKYWRTPDGKSLILQAGKGRYDLWRGFQQGFFASSSVVRNPKVERLVSKLLVQEFTNYSGVILSEPGSSDQYFHRDTDTLSNTDTDGKSLMMVDDFYFTTLIPITVDMTPENGATDFMVGSHRQPAANFGSLETAQVRCPVGSALLFNGKINHRGRGNASKVGRPAIYTVYHKRWYNDNFRMGVDEQSGNDARPIVN